MIHTIRPNFAWSAKVVAPLVVLTLTLAGCSSGSSSNSAPAAADGGAGAGAGAGDGGTGGQPPVPPSGGGPIDPNAEGSAGVWSGNFGFATAGTYVIDNEGNFYGLTNSGADEVLSTFGNIGTGTTYAGPLDTYSHSLSAPGEPGSAPSTSGELIEPVTYDLTIVPGNQIVSNDTARAIALVYEAAGNRTPATPAELAGDWTGTHSFCDASSVCRQLPINATFTAEGGVSGTTDVLTDGASGFPNTFVGALTPFGDVSLVNLEWTFQENSEYDGVLYMETDGSTLVLVSRVTDQTTIDPERGTQFVTRLTRQP